MDDLLPDDLAHIARHGLAEERASRQLRLLREPPPTVELARPATVSDGVLRLAEERHDELLEIYEDAAGRGRFSKFVPASGAASRMFQSLAAVCYGQGGERDRRACEECLRNLDRLPFRDDLAAVLASRGTSLEAVAGRGDVATLLPALLEGEGLDLERKPKGLVPFHRYAEPLEIRTPFEEHLAEAAAHVRDRDGVCRIHFTILRPHEEEFLDFTASIRDRFEERFEACFEIAFSFQEPATDTLAADLDGRPFRDHDGRLVLRPGGHGALIDNLERLGGDLVFIKNVDNVVPDHRRAIVLRWKKLLGGYLLALERRLVELLERPRDGAGWIDDARAFLAGELGIPDAVLPASTEGLEALLDRPLRVCGVVPVTGEPGGGPFWVRGSSGESLQIVETSQIDTARQDQARILNESTHFNPVDLVCRLRGHGGRPYELERYADREAVFVARKFHEGRPLLALEHPGLWNGAMAFWNTVFVEVPGATFAPVKTVLDLLRPEHQAG